MTDSLPNDEAIDVCDWESLLLAAHQGDDRALNEVWKQVRSYLLLTADDIGDGLQGKVDSSDIVQQSLMEAHQNFGSFRGQTESEVRAWLVRIVQNNLIDAGRRYRETQQRDVAKEFSLDAANSPLDEPATDKTASSLVRRQEVDEQLLRAVALLPERSQQLLQLRHHQGLSHADAAKELGMTETATRKLWSRTVQELRDWLVSDDAESSP